MFSTRKNQISAKEAKQVIILRFQERRIRQGAKLENKAQYLGGFGKATNPFPILLTDKAMFAFLDLKNQEKGCLRYLTPIECERLMGLPDNWTYSGVEGTIISDNARYKVLGNSIVLPCAEYIMSGIAEVFNL